MKRCAVILAAVLSAAMLSGCYRTELPLVTRDNAHPTAVLADGTYCEAVFLSNEGALVPTLTDTCVTLEWVPEARGWRTDTALGTDEDGVSVRLRRLGTGNNAVGLSSFFLVQAGPAPRQVSTGTTVVPLANAYLMGGFVRDDMFILIGARTGQSQDQALARAQQHGIGLAAIEDDLSIRSIAGLSGANIAGAWMAQELAREIHAAELPGTASDPGVVRIFVPRAGTGMTNGSPEFLAHMQLMLDALLFEAGVLNQALGLGLAPPQIDLAVLDAPEGKAPRHVPPAQQPIPSAAPPKPAASAKVQATYEELQFCRGMLQILEVQTLALQSDVGFRMFAAAQADQDELSWQLMQVHEGAGKLYQLMADTVTDLKRILDFLKTRGVNQQHGPNTRNPGTAVEPLPQLHDGLSTRELIDILRKINEGFGRAHDCIANAQAR